MSEHSKELMDSVDHAWLRMESAKNFMMIGVVLIFETELDIEKFRQILQTRLIDRHPRFTQKIIHEHGQDYWQTDPYFSLDNHVIPSGFPLEGDSSDLQAIASALISTPLALDKPLWCINTIGHYQEGSAIVIRIHHCIADGMSLVRLIISLADEQKNPENTQLCMEKPTEGAGTHQHESIRDLIAHPSHIVDAIAHGVSGAEELAAVTLRPGDPKTSLKGTLTGSKSVSWLEPFPLADVKLIGQKVGATVNDILMSTAAGAIRAHLLRTGEMVDGKTIHAAVPFNLRPIDSPIEQLGNQFGLVIVPLAIGIADPLERLNIVKQEMIKLKHSYQAHVFFFLLQVLGKGPSILEKTALDLLSSKASLVMTNVPGPKNPLYLAGAKLKQPLVWVPQSGDIGIGLSILTYNQTVQFGIVADTDLIKHPDSISDSFMEEFRLLQMLAMEDLHNVKKGD